MRQVLGIFLLIVVLAMPAIAVAQNPGFEEVSPGTYVKVPTVFKGSQGPAGQLSLGQVLLQIFNIALLVVGSIAVLFLIYGGFRYIFARGSEEDAETAKKTIYHSLVGLAIVILSFAIVALISRLLIIGQP